MNDSWFDVANIPEIDSPALLVYPERVEENVCRMISMAGGTARLRPHIKTHKIPELISLQRRLGLEKFKCATVAEAEMAASREAKDVLLAYQPVGPTVKRLLQLVEKFPGTKFSTIADDETVIRALSTAATQRGIALELLLDLDCGMQRCGIEPGDQAASLYRLISSLPGLKAGGLHVYDGHIHDSEVESRRRHFTAAFAPIEAFAEKLTRENLSVPKIVAGGTPTFPFHAARPNVECSPGTCVFWDLGYSTKFPDLNFLVAALVLTRVVSKPAGSRLCLDLGHKAVASENPPPRVQFLNLPEARPISHSEEHLVIETERAAEFQVGDCLYGVPWHICPTVALHSEAVAIEQGRAMGRWKIIARDRKITV